LEVDGRGAGTEPPPDLFSDFRRSIRERELQTLAHFLPPPPARLLEIGGGDGHQATLLEALGYRVSSVDIRESAYSGHRRFSIIDYDGRSLPFLDCTFDIVFSSNVLEHVMDLPAFLAETRRVLRRDGSGVHVMPTGAWRFWTSIAHYIDVFRRVMAVGRSRGLGGWALALREVRRDLIPPRHGETGNALTEIWSFSRWRWRREFRRNGWSVEREAALRLFYTGHLIHGERWPLSYRAQLSNLLGSACVLYSVRDARLPT
jgi:SAM-dependent methyltransferase